MTMKDKPVILVVDDQPKNIELLEAYLVPEGYEIVPAESGEEALDKLSVNQIDLILLDVMMPGMDGFKITRMVRQDNIHRLLPIILVTALRETEDRVKGIEAGCDDFISKPVDKMELLARVRSLLKVKAYNDLMSNYREELAVEVTKRTGELKQSLENVQREIIERKRVEEVLRESEKKYRLLADNVNDVICILDMNLNYTYISPSIKILRGYEQEELLKQPSFEMVTPSSRELAMRTLSEVMELEKSEHRDIYISRILPLELMRKDGTTVWTEVKFSFVRDENKQPVGILSVIRDVTERKRAEDELNEITGRLQLAMVAAKAGIWDWNLQTNEMNWDDRMLELYGLTHENFSGGIKAWEQGLHPDDASRAMEESQAALRGELDFNTEFRVRHPDGKVVHIKANGLVLRDEEGKPLRMIGLNTDITDRKQAEESLRVNRQQLADIIRFLPDATLAIDKEKRIIIWNKAIEKMTGMPAAEMIGKGNYAYSIPFYGEERPQLMDLVLLDQNEEIAARYSNITFDDGSIMADAFCNALYNNKGAWVFAKASPLHDQSGNIIGAIESIRDITDRKQAEEKLQQTLESLRKSFGATVQVMVSAIESRDPYTSGHQVRSANLACAIATEMGLSQDKIEGLRMAGSIHDIGKISIPAELLSKPTKLSELEFSMIKEHAQRGYEMLKDVESPWPLAEIVHQHHERMDGSGYPRNLKGAEILMEARILTVADVVEAMASHRPYRAGLGIDAALNEIEKNSGIFYDKAVVDACLKLFREKGFKLEGA